MDILCPHKDSKIFSRNTLKVIEISHTETKIRCSWSWLKTSFWSSTLRRSQAAIQWPSRTRLRTSAQGVKSSSVTHPALVSASARLPYVGHGFQRSPSLLWKYKLESSLIHIPDCHRINHREYIFAAGMSLGCYSLPVLLGYDARC